MIKSLLRNFIFILVLVLCFVSLSKISPVVGLAFAARPAPKTPWLTPWLYRKTVVIENYSNNRTLDAYQVKIVLDSSNFDFSAAKPQGEDLRVTDTNGTSLLSLWIENYDQSSRSATIWTKVPTILPTSTKVIYLYYGNNRLPGGKPASDGKNTFDFFDDFNRPAWAVLPPMPVNRADLTAATLNGKIYLFGGYDQAAGDSRAEVYEFNPANNVYTQKANMPTPRWGPIAVPVGGKIYVFAGENAGNPVPVNEMYDPVANTWTSKANVPSNMGFQGITGCSDGSKIYLFYNGLGYTYDPQADTYLPIPSPPQPVLSWATCAYSNGKIYFLGGFFDGVGRTYNQIYSISSATWSSGAPLPFGVYGAVRENPIIGDTLYIIEGQRATNEFSSKAYAYSITNNAWSEKTLGPYVKDGNAGAAVNSKIYIFGGRRDGQGPYGVNFASSYTPSADSPPVWIQKSGNFQIRNGKLMQNDTPYNVGGPYSQLISNNFQTNTDFVIETVSEQSNTGGSWNSLGIHGNSGTYPATLIAYLTPYNDFGIQSPLASLYLLNNGGFSHLSATTNIDAGTYRYKVVSTASRIDIYRNNELYLSTTNTQFRNGYLHILGGLKNQVSWDFLFIRKYASVEPTVRVEADQIKRKGK